MRLGPATPARRRQNPHAYRKAGKNRGDCDRRYCEGEELDEDDKTGIPFRKGETIHQPHNHERRHLRDQPADHLRGNRADQEGHRIARATRVVVGSAGIVIRWPKSDCAAAGAARVVSFGTQETGHPVVGISYFETMTLQSVVVPRCRASAASPDGRSPAQGSSAVVGLPDRSATA